MIILRIVVEEDSMMETANKIPVHALDGVAQLAGAPSHTWKSPEFDSWSGHTPTVWAVSLVGCVLEAVDPCSLKLLSVSLPFSVPHLSSSLWNQ